MKTRMAVVHRAAIGPPGAHGVSRDWGPNVEVNPQAESTQLDPVTQVVVDSNPRGMDATLTLMVVTAETNHAHDGGGDKRAVHIESTMESHTQQMEHWSELPPIDTLHQRGKANWFS